MFVYKESEKDIFRQILDRYSDTLPKIIYLQDKNIVFKISIIGHSLNFVQVVLLYNIGVEFKKCIYVFTFFHYSRLQKNQSH